MIYVVLGMHKSGTTLVAQTLHASGINMGEFDELRVGYDQGHKYERREAQAINRAVLQGVLRSPPDLPLSCARSQGFDEAGYPLNDDAAAIVREPILNARLTLEPARANIRQLIAQCNARYPDWGFKDPRTCLTYPIWASELPEHKLIVVYRGYAALLRRNLRLRRHRVPLINLPRIYGTLQAWLVHNLRVIRYAQRSSVPVIVLNYDGLMEDENVWGRLRAFVGRPLSDVRNPALYRNRLHDPARLAFPAELLTPFLPQPPRMVLNTLDQMSKKARFGGQSRYPEFLL